MPSVSRCTSTLAGFVLVVACVLASCVGPSVAHADGTLPPNCRLANGIIVCADSGTGSDGTGTIPPGCTVVQGVTVCGDGTTGGSGSVCVTASDGTKSCLNGGGSFGGGGIASLGKGLGSVLGTPQQTTGTGWLSRLTGWFSYALNTLFTALVGFFKDLVTYVLAVVLGVVALAISMIPVPTFLQGISLGSMLGQTGSVVGFFMMNLQIPAALGMIGAGYAFRLLRKFLTLFQW